MTLEAHDKPDMFLIVMMFVLGLILLLVAGVYVAVPELSTSMSSTGSGAARAVQSLPPMTQAAVLGVGGLGAFGFGVHLMQKRTAKRKALQIDDEGVRTFKSTTPDLLAWSEIESVSVNRTMMAVHGSKAAGGRVKLKVNIGQLDVKPQQVFEAIGQRRPDLVG